MLGLFAILGALGDAPGARIRERIYDRELDIDSLEYVLVAISGFTHALLDPMLACYVIGYWWWHRRAAELEARLHIDTIACEYIRVLTLVRGTHPVVTSFLV